MSTTDLLTAAQLRRMLALPDLTAPGSGHVLRLVLDRIETAYAHTTGRPVRQERRNAVVPVADNYDRLGYPPGAAARDARYTRYVRDDLMLRAHTSATVPALLDELADEQPAEVVLSVPGLAYRRDAIDRQHVGEPHQVDLWHLRPGAPALAVDDLDVLVATVVAAVLPQAEVRSVPASHPYTREGRQVDVRVDGTWVEVGECGLADPDLLARCGLEGWTGLASGWGLDRLVMLGKGIDDIRLLRSTDPRVRAQMRDLSPYETVSDQPATRRDLSLAVAADHDEEVLGARLRDALGADAEVVEELAVVARTPVADLPPQAAVRLGADADQHNALLRLVLRHPTRTLTADEANVLRDRVYAALHRGEVYDWACGHPPEGWTASP